MIIFCKDSCAICGRFNIVLVRKIHLKKYQRKISIKTDYQMIDKLLKNSNY